MSQIAFKTQVSHIEPSQSVLYGFTLEMEWKSLPIHKLLTMSLQLSVTIPHGNNSDAQTKRQITMVDSDNGRVLNNERINYGHMP